MTGFGDTRPPRVIVLHSDQPWERVRLFQEPLSDPRFADIDFIPPEYVGAIATRPGQSDRFYAVANYSIARATGGPLLYRSDDRGKSWARTSARTFGQAANLHLVVAPDGKVFIADGSFVRSDDGGTTWNDLPLSRPSALALDPKDPGALYIVDRIGPFQLLGSLHHSRDSGVNWTRMQFQSPGFCPDMEMVVDPRRAVTLYIAGGCGFFRSSDDGRTWQTIEAPHRPLRSSGFQFAPSNPDVLYVAGVGGVSRSYDGGETWQYVDRTSRVDAITFDNRDPNREALITGGSIASYGRGVRWSIDDGQTWVDLGAPPGTGRINCLLALGDTLFVGTENGLWKLPLPELP
jgi:photosystem II stability/assembly factor-like uncharacterized protein